MQKQKRNCMKELKSATAQMLPPPVSQFLFTEASVPPPGRRMHFLQSALDVRNVLLADAPFGPDILQSLP